MIVRTFVPLDLEYFTGQNPNGVGLPPVEFSMRKGIVHTYAHLGQPNLVLAARLIPETIASPTAIFDRWMDLESEFPDNVVYTRHFDGPEATVGAIRVLVPRDSVFGVIADRDMEIIDYDWFEGCGIPGFPNGHNDPNIIGGLRWQLT